MKFCLLLILSVFLGLTMGSGKPIDIESEHFTLELPDSWTVTPEWNGPAAAISGDNSSVLAFHVIPNPENRGWEPGLIKSFREQILDRPKLNHGQGELVEEKRLKINGLAVYLIKTKSTYPDAPPLDQSTYLVFANRKIYLMVLKTGEPSHGPILEGIAGSLRFSSPPELPDTAENATERNVPVTGEPIEFHLPAGWVSVPMEGYVFFAKNGSYSSTVTLTKYPNPKNTVVGKTLAQTMTKSLSGLLGGRMQVLAEGPCVVGGVPGFYETNAISLTGKDPEYTGSYVLPVVGSIYVVRTLAGDKENIPVVEAIAKSLHFTTPPQISPPAGESDFDRGYRVGRITFFVLLCAVLGRVGFLIWRWSRRKSMPPPPPRI